MTTALPLAATAAIRDSNSLLGDSGLVLLLGGVAGALALLGLLLLLPLYVTHRREVGRLLEWKDHEPDAGTTEFQAVSGPGATVPSRPPGAMTPAQRVTSERPALARVTTAEHAALELEQTPLWRRVIERGPRHPLILALLALLVAGAIFVAAGLLIRSGSDGSGSAGGGLDPASVQIVVVNAASVSGVAGDLGDDLAADGFDVVAVTVASDAEASSSVLYGKGAKPEGRAVARSLGLTSPQPFDPEAEAAANGADVVVIAGQDAEASPSGGKG